MLVCSLPRCGATKFCLDLADKTNLEFVGEVNPIYLESYNDTKKQIHHESNYQPTYSNTKFIETLTYPNKYIALVNTMPYLVINQADYILLRRNMYDAFLSTANFLMKCDNTIKAEYVIQRLNMMYESLIAISLYVRLNKKEVVWYEEYFSRSGTDTSILDDSRYKQIIYRHIDGFMNHNDIKELK
jgi:hypothetical protein